MDSFIKIKNVVYEIFRRDDDGNVTDVNHALDGITLDIEDGDFVAVLGHNGSGKSTLARHMNALLAPTEGAVWIDGKDTSDEANELSVRRMVGMVFQNPDNQIVAGVVEEDVGFGPENIGVPTEEIWERVTEALQAVGMHAYREHSPNRLSGGQKQRVAIAGIMAMKPRCIVFDEATAMLDPAGRKDVLEAVRLLNRKEHITVIWITHYMEEVTLADRVVVLDHGQIVMQGSSREVFAKADELERYQLAVPEVTRLARELAGRGIPVPQDVLTEEELIQCLKQAEVRQ